MPLTTFVEVSLAALIKSAILAFVLITAFAYMTLLERKVMAYLQVRIGPNRAGPGGFLQPAADGLKLMFKEELIPAGADRVMFIVAPIITVIPALVIMAVVPFGPTVELFGYQIPLAISDINVGLLYILSVASIAVYGIVLAGWSSNNKYATLGGLRSTAQMVSYEIALGLSIVGPIMLAGSMSLQDIVNSQTNLWNVVLQPVGALIFFIATLAEVNRAPFDMPEAEQELTAGYHTEYSGMKFSLFFMAEYIKMVAVSGIGVTLFFGGYLGPFLDVVPSWMAGLLGLIYFTAKTVAFLVGMIWIRASLPRMRYDQLMGFGWKVMLPLALANIAVTAVAQLVFRG
jgi:NADH-quinone oxidoreductase subunit H